MNAEFHVDTSFTVEFETSGVALTVFNGNDSDGTVYTATYDDLVLDLIDMCTFDNEGRMENGDRDYLHRVVRALKDVISKIDAAIDHSITKDVEDLNVEIDGD